MMVPAEISFHLSWNPIIVFGCVVVAVVIAYFSYRRPLPPVGIYMRIALTTLRSLGLACLLLAIAEPVATLISITFQQPVVAVLLDQSQSMTITDRDGKRDEHIRTLLRESPFHFGSDSDIRYFGFSNRLHAIPVLNPDSIRFYGSETDIASAIREIRRIRDEQNIQGVVLISDGDVTAGENPVYDAEELGIPIFSIGVGDSSEQRDVLLSNVFANTIGYVESVVPIDATIQSIGCEGTTVDVTLSEGPATIQKKSILLGPGLYSAAIQFAVTPKEEGIHKYTLRVSSVEGELTGKNNSRSFFIKVLKSKI
jgi:hypothetical protein